MVSAFKKIINKITGNEDDPFRAVQLRGFGKLPASREYVQLEAGQGSAKIFQDWVKAGHDRWVTCVEPEKRGQIVPSCLLAVTPELKDHAIVARIWNSQDCAAPPRTFPFTFFLVVRNVPELSLPEQFILYTHFWSKLDELFEPVYDGRQALQVLREHSLNIDNDTLSKGVEQMTQEVRGIVLSTWLDAVLPCTRCSDPIELLWLLRTLLGGWRKDHTAEGLGVRFPMSRAFSFEAQAFAWLQWLNTNLDADRLRPLTGLFVPQNVPEAEPAVALTTRALMKGDLQLLTTNAHDYEYIEDVAQASRDLQNEGRDEFELRLKTLLNGRNKTLWDWAGYRL